MIRSLLIAATVAAALTTGAQAQDRRMTSNEVYFVGFVTNYCPKVRVSKATMRRALYTFMIEYGLTNDRQAALYMDALVLNEFSQFSDAKIREMCRTAAPLVGAL